MVNPNRFYTYAYLRKDKTPYYIGKGQGGRLYKKSKGEVGKPKDKSRIIFLKQNITEEEAFRHEKYMISVFGRKDLGTGVLHNKTNGGEGVSGHIVSDEVKEKLKQFNTGKKHTEETKKKLSEIIKFKFKDKIEKKLRESWIGKNHSDESKRKISQKNKGYTHTEEAKQKISEKKKGKILSEDHKRKLREANMGKKHTEQSKKKMSEAMKCNKNRKGKVLKKDKKIT
jgi:hypothetical protein